MMNNYEDSSFEIEIKCARLRMRQLLDSRFHQQTTPNSVVLWEYSYFNNYVRLLKVFDINLKSVINVQKDYLVICCLSFKNKI